MNTTGLTFCLFGVMLVSGCKSTRNEPTTNLVITAPTVVPGQLENASPNSLPSYDKKALDALLKPIGDQELRARKKFDKRTMRKIFRDSLRAWHIETNKGYPDSFRPLTKNVLRKYHISEDDLDGIYSVAADEHWMTADEVRESTSRPR
jgi:hypothetical protein